MAQSSRDMRGWMQKVERGLNQISTIPASISRAVTTIREEQETRLNLTPTFPVELTYSTAFYLSPRGSRRSRVVIDFPDVTKATDGTVIAIKHYELWGKDDTAGILAGTTSAVPGTALPGTTMPGLVSTDENQAIEAEEKPWEMVASSVGSYFRTENFIPGSWWRFRVRAIGVSTIVPGAWSAEIVVQMAPDETPPPQPTAPTLRSDRGVLTVSWDGQSVLGAMPADFKYAILAHGTASSPTHEIARFDRGGGFKVVAAPYNTPQFFRVRAFDESGNEGPWSEQVVGITSPLVDTDIILSEIDGAKTILKNIDADVAILPGSIIAKHITVTEELTANVAQFLEVKAGMIDVNELWADSAFFGKADATLFRGDAFEGKVFTGGQFIGPTFKTNVEEFTGIKWDTTGIKAWGAGGSETFAVSAATGTVTTVGRFYTSPAGQPGIAIVPPLESWNGLDMGIWFAPDSHQILGGVTAGMWIADPGTTLGRLNVRGANNGGVSIHNSLRLTGSSGVVTSEHEIMLNSQHDIILDSGAGKTIKLTHEGGSTPYALTSSAPANMYMHSTGQLFKSTSSLRYKTDVQPWDPAYRVLDLELFSWVDRRPVDPADPLQRYYGLTAEQTFEVMPELAILNEFGEPDAVQYERVGVALIPAFRSLLKRVEALERAV